LKEKAATVTLLMLLSVAFLFMPLSVVTGQLGVNIYLLNPESEGVAGQNVNLQGTIDTSNGRYQIWFSDRLVLTNSSEGYYVNADFTIPPLPEGTYSITLRDVTTNENTTQDFTLKLAYYIEAQVPPSPELLQEGSSVVLNATIAGVQSGTTYHANVTVTLPAPLSTSYSRIVELSASGEETVATALVTYPAAAFQPEGSLTDYAGTYHVSFNDTLATGQFVVGFTNSSLYHRGQTVAVNAIGYQPDENATITIVNEKTNSEVYSETVAASSEGVVSSSYTVPSDALISNYNITITPETTEKLIRDSQIFSVPGYSITVNTLNLAGEPVGQIVVEALDEATDTVYNGTSLYDGTASLKLETGNHVLTAYWNDVAVGEMNVTITGAGSFDLTCRLTNLKITVKNEQGNLIPFVSLDITYQYVTTKSGTSKTGSASGETDLSGTFVLNSVLPGISYTVNASLYGVVFNTDNKTVSNVPVQPLSEVVIICPTMTLTLKIVDYNMEAIPNARIELVEISSGLFHGVVTDAAGTVTVDVTFGKYRLRVYKDEILLNSTVIEVFSDSQREVRCSLYNIQVSVMVVDYFNQPIPNMNVVFNGPGAEARSSTTQANGATTFGGVIGGDIQIIAYPEGAESSYEAVSLSIEEPTTVEIQLAKYILIGPFLIESSALATLIVVVVAVLLFVSIEVIMRRRAKRSDRES
jgi:LysM repeat protein